MQPSNEKRDWKPRIVGFLCNWCAYAGADLAGVSRIQYPPDLRIIRVMCSGRVDPVLVIEAFLAGMDGVAVLGCHPGDCHYLTGNYQAEKKMTLLAKILEKVGIAEDRLYLEWVSAAEGVRFGEVVDGFTNKVKELGPLGSRENVSQDRLRESLYLAKRLVESERMRWLVGRQWELLEKQNAYGEKVAQAEYDDLLEASINGELSKARILSLIEKEPLTVKEIAERVGSTSTDVFRWITYMRDTGEVSLVDIQDVSPRYTRVVQK